jgi:predicted GNAT family N-acyltransferase
LGFRCLGDGNPFDEDGIPHVEMISAPETHDIF